MAGRRVTKAAFLAELRERFGDDPLDWTFVCPVCKHPQSGRDYKAAGAPSTAIGFSCVGRWIPGSNDAFDAGNGGPCTYAGGGLFKLNPVLVHDPERDDVAGYFELAEAPS